MRAGFVWLAALALLPLTGAPLLARPAFRNLPPASRVILSAGAGAVLVSFAMTVFALAGLPWHVGLLALAAALLAFALSVGLGASPAPGPPSFPASGEGRVVRLAQLLALLAVAAALVATVTGAAGSNDLIFFWAPKAQRFAAARTIDAEFLSAPLLRYMHAPYPPLVTNLYALASMAAGRFAWGAAVLTFPLLLASIAAALPGLLRGGSSRPAAAANTALIACSLAYIGMAQNVAGNGEMALLFFEVLGMAVLLSPVASGSAGQLLAGLFLAGAATAKVEGLPFALAAAALFPIVRKDRSTPAWKSLLLLLLPTALALGAWFAFGASRGIFRQYETYGGIFEFHPGHLGVILRAIGESFWHTGYALPYVVPLLAFLAQARRSSRMFLPLGVAAALAAFFLFTYLHLASDPREWILWSAGRIFSPVPPLLALAATCASAGDAGDTAG